MKQQKMIKFGWACVLLVSELIVGNLALSAKVVPSAKRSEISISGASVSLPLRPTVIYGTDDRKDVFEEYDLSLQSLADSTLAMVHDNRLQSLPDGRVKLMYSQFSVVRNLCMDERFSHQPTSPYCSAFLVGPDLVATASHCLTIMPCNEAHFVFGFKMKSEHEIGDTFDESEHYRCKQVLKSEYSASQDYALLKLDRPVLGHKSLSLGLDPVQKGQTLFGIGHPAGLPTKIMENGIVREISSGFFKTTLDAFGGSSGSPVFDGKSHKVVGILVRGDDDFVYDGANRCNRSRICGEDECRGEDVTQIEYIVKAIKGL